MQHTLECSDKGPQEKVLRGKHAGKAGHILPRDPARAGLALGVGAQRGISGQLPNCISLDSLLPPLGRTSHPTRETHPLDKKIRHENGVGAVRRGQK